MLSLMFPGLARMATDANHGWIPTGGFFSRTVAGVEVDDEKALTYSAVFRCSRLLTEPPSSLPLRCFRKTDGDRVQVSASEVPAIDLVSLSPNDDMTAGVWRETIMLQQVNSGNGFAEISRDDFTGEIKALYPIHASRVMPAKQGSGFAYSVRNNDGTYSGFRREEMLHVCGTLSNDGIWGRGVVTHARENIGGGLAVERYGAAFFGSGGQPKGVVIAPGLTKPADRDQFRREWGEMVSSPDAAHKVAILPGMSSYTAISMSHQDSQFLETGIRNQEIICNWYGVPLYMLGAKILGSSLEGLSGEFIIYSLYPWVSKLEQQLNFKLLDRNQRGTHGFEHDFSALLRGDIQSRMNAYRVAIMTGVFTINHCRRLENLPGIGPAGDVTYVPANMVTAEYMRENGAGSSVGPGSNQTGAPADNPNDRNPKADAAFHEFVKGKGLDGKALKQEIAVMETKIDDRPREWKEAARVVLSDTLRRMFTKEAGAAVAAMDSRKDFSVWSAEFFAKHEATLAGALEPACATLKLAGVKRWEKPADLAAWIKARSADDMKRTANDSKEVRLRKLAAWPTDRVAAIVEEVMRS